MTTETVDAARKWLEKNAKRKVGSHVKASPKAAALALPVDGPSKSVDALKGLQASERAVTDSINKLTAELEAAAV
jgi:uncharacterized protein YhbP (UPF0306 family)